MIDPTIFKAYDVRGTYPDQMNEEVAYAIGAAFIAHFGVPRIAVGHDMRLSSPALFEAFKHGVTAQDAELIDLGMTSTDELYFAVGKFGYPAGAMTTASHIQPGTMEDVQRLVRETDADLGVAFDGDADRMFITDEHGELVDGGMVTAMVARNLLKKNPGATILYNLIVSRCVPELIARL